MLPVPLAASRGVLLCTRNGTALGFRLCRTVSPSREASIRAASPPRPARRCPRQTRCWQRCDASAKHDPNHGHQRRRRWSKSPCRRRPRRSPPGKPSPEQRPRSRRHLPRSSSTCSTATRRTVVWPLRAMLMHCSLRGYKRRSTTARRQPAPPSSRMTTPPSPRGCSSRSTRSSAARRPQRLRPARRGRARSPGSRCSTSRTRAATSTCARRARPSSRVSRRTTACRTVTRRRMASSLDPCPARPSASSTCRIPS